MDDQELLGLALDLEAVAQRELLEGDDAVAAEGFVAVADTYRRSWEAAGPLAFGRLVGMLKARVLAGAEMEEAAAYARAEVPEPASPTAWYVRGICAAIEG